MKLRARLHANAAILIILSIMLIGCENARPTDRWMQECIEFAIANDGLDIGAIADSTHKQQCKALWYVRYAYDVWSWDRDHGLWYVDNQDES